MLQAIPPQDENNTEKYPVIVTFDKGSVWLKRRGKPAKTSAHADQREIENMKAGPNPALTGALNAPTMAATESS